MSPLSTTRRLALLEKVTGPRHSVADVENMREIEIGRRAVFALRRAVEANASAEMILAAQKIAERLIGAGGPATSQGGAPGLGRLRFCGRRAT